MDIQSYPNPEKLSRAAARFFVDQANNAVAQRGRFTIALSGGSSPQRMYELLASDDFKQQVPWQDVYVFWGDERFVPPDDPQNNARMANRILLAHVPVPARQVYPIPTGGKPADAARRYSRTLKDFFGAEAFPRFDFMLLGLGKNGHTASLFPHTDVLEEKEKWTEALFVAEANQHRITLTAPVINNARDIVFLAYGSSKSKTIARVIEGPQNTDELPAQLIAPSNGQLNWFLDEEAARLLS